MCNISCVILFRRILKFGNDVKNIKCFLFPCSSSALVHPDNQMLGFLAYNPVDALGAMELPHGEFLLVFNTLGVYVDMQGRKSRDREIMYPAVPTVSHPSPPPFPN